ncbi:MAG: hypothetical protein HQK88_04365 [Nitrospirae bacterium]|nr:hypothetical protein [Nitrospirota bacterium]MBF0533439.1 hypothetical protein [Nitrospirota bacterium]MBF0616037.1 hypothetical protein [Nitrospirota bacterium]
MYKILMKLLRLMVFCQLKMYKKGLDSRSEAGMTEEEMVFSVIPAEAGIQFFCRAY